MQKFAWNEYFKWAQRNTLNESIKHLINERPPNHSAATKEIRFFDNLKVRDLESFRYQEQQLDFDPLCHVGGAPGSAAPPVVGHPIPPNPQANLNWAAIHALAAQAPAPRQPRATGNRHGFATKEPQWPLIFNGHNLAAELGGSCGFIQYRTGNPAVAPLRPGGLTEAQAQWLMETAWAQRAFLSAYTTAIITNKQNFANIHTLRISKLSSGLLPSLAQREFWSSLPGLKKLQILVSPDWRQEHIIGDRYHHMSMPISPHKATQRFTEFLNLFVVRIESLHSLSIGYVGGGEHAVGIFARNQHVLPAPILVNPAGWLHEVDDVVHRSVLVKFDHIRDLKFENCWFSPRMLVEFMKQSRDASLHTLSLDSVSLLTNHDPTLDQPLTVGGNNLQCRFDRNDWLHEQLPTSAAWAQVIDSITPGFTLLEHKYDAGLIDPKTNPRPAKAFRGHVQTININSCGYVKITLPKTYSNVAFNQNSAVTHLVSPVDAGLRTRRERFHRSGIMSSNAMDWSDIASPSRRADSDEGPKRTMTMMSTASPSGETYPWLGTLTQCVHPIEKRVLEEGWKMQFGWPGRLDRWCAVEDGCYEGGTGRFSGIIVKEEQSQTQLQQEGD